jgi:drug/metabolite transporter superfamily protein YnfA
VFTLLQVFGCVVAFLWLRRGVTIGLIGMTLLLALFVFLIARYSKRVRE